MRFAVAQEHGVLHAHRCSQQRHRPAKRPALAQRRRHTQERRNQREHARAAVSVAAAIDERASDHARHERRDQAKRHPGLRGRL